MCVNLLVSMIHCVGSQPSRDEEWPIKREEMKTGKVEYSCEGIQDFSLVMKESIFISGI